MNCETLKTSQRINRILFGTALIVFTMLVSVNPLGWIAVLPLLATYPVFAGIYGYDPVLDFGKYQYAVIRRAAARLAEFGHPTHHA